MRAREMMMVLLPLALAACGTTRGTGGGTTPAPATTGANATVDRLLQESARLAREKGYVQAAGRPASGSLNNATSEEVELTLNPGREYLMIGVCDDDCSDMDLTLTSPAGNQVAEDVLEDDTPVLQFTAPEAGRYRVRVVMAACGSDPCFYGVALYAR